METVFHIRTPEAAWGGSTGSGVKVAVVDSGIDASHPALSGSVRGGVDIEILPEGIQNLPCSFTDVFGHGTACAGIIKDIAPDVELYSVKVLGSNLQGSGEAFLAGIKWAIDSGMHVVNLSLGTIRREYFAPLHELVDYAYFKRSILIAAANNVPPPSYPSIFSSLVSVANLNIQDKLSFTFSYGQRIELGARGTRVSAPWLDHSYREVTGTSFAAPHISGIVALILGKHPDLTPFQIKSILYELGRQQ